MPAGAKSPSPEAAVPSRPKWAPSARVLGLTEEQLEETRERLRVVVDDPAGKPAPPIESFDDMVRKQPWLACLTLGGTDSHADGEALTTSNVPFTVAMASDNLDSNLTPGVNYSLDVDFIEVF